MMGDLMHDGSRLNTVERRARPVAQHADGPAAPSRRRTERGVRNTGGRELKRVTEKSGSQSLSARVFSLFSSILVEHLVVSCGCQASF